MDPKKMVEDLQKPNAYPESTTSVKLVQTHISWVFICDDFVYKVKKPVNFGFLDFSTLEKRKYYCHQEVELNSRLAKEIYLGVIPIALQEGTFKIAAEGEVESPVEYAVKMRVIPDDVLLKNKFKAGLLTDKDIENTAKAIAKFHASAARSPEIDKFGSLETVKFNTDENFEQTEKYISTSISRAQFDALKQWNDRFYTEHADLLEERVAAGKVRDCHGDLHMEHICLTEPITIIDCIEFNDRFRYSDTVSDLAFLLMDLEFRGGEKVAELLYDHYKGFSGESGVELDLLLRYYKVYRAYVRGKVASFQLDDPNIPDAKKEDAIKNAREYFELAYSYIRM